MPHLKGQSMLATAQRRAAVVAAIRAGKTREQAAEEFGLGLSYVVELACKDGLRRKRGRPANKPGGIRSDTAAYALYVLDHLDETHEQIAAVLGVSRQAVTDLHKKLFKDEQSNQR